MAVKTFTVRDGEFTEYMKRPLISGDVGAYKIVFRTDYDLTNHNVRITAKRSDGVILEDVGRVSGQNAEYTLKSSIYSVSGEVEVRMIVGDSRGNCLTEKALVFDVIANHESGDMQQATDNGKSVSDLALAHIYNMQDPHNSREILGIDRIITELLDKISYEVVTKLPDIGVAEVNKLYLICEKDEDWSIDNSDAVHYDIYIKTESSNDSGVYAWTKLEGNSSVKAHTHTTADIDELDEALARKIEDVAYGSPDYSPSAELVELFSSGVNGNKSIWVDDACDFFAYRCFDTNQRLGIMSDGGEIYRNSFYVAISTSRFDWTNNKIRIFDILPQLYNNSVIDTHIHVRAGYLSEDSQYMQTDNPIGAYLDGMELFLMSNYSEADYIVVMGYVDTSIYGVNMNGVREIN